MIGIKIKMFKNSLEGEKGIAVLYVIFVAGIVSAIVLGISTILMHQAKTIRETGNSVVAFYAADSCVEMVLTKRGEPMIFDGQDLEMTNEIRCELSVVDGGDDDCDADNYCIRSVGTYKKTKRAIEISY